MYIRDPLGDDQRMRLISYLRVSSDGQVDGWGLDAQRTAIDAWIERHGHDLVDECRDEGIPGDVLDRPGLTDALSRTEAEGIVTARLDRLARSLTVQEALLAAMWRDDWTVFAVDVGEIRRDDPDDPMRTAMRQMAGVFAQLDRALLVKRLRDGRRAKSAAGGKGVGAYPFGHSKDGPVPREVAILEAIDELRTAGATWQQVADALNDRGASFAPRSATTWAWHGVRRIGVIANCKLRQT